MEKTATVQNHITHVFKEVNKGRYKSTRHYELVETQNGKTQLSTQVNIAKDRQFAKSNPDYWIKKREGNKWSKPLTGLFKTQSKNIFKGDDNKRENLILFKFSDDYGTLTVYYFLDHFTNNVEPIIKSVIN